MSIGIVRTGFDFVCPYISIGYDLFVRVGNWLVAKPVEARILLVFLTVTSQARETC